MIISKEIRELAKALGISTEGNGTSDAIRDLTKAVKEGRVHLGGGASSWNDLKDKPFGETEDYIVPEVPVTFDPTDPGLGILAGVEFSLTVGEKYTVNWNGTDYNCTAQEYADPDVGEKIGVLLGNTGFIVAGENTDEPFVILAIYPEYAPMIGNQSNMVVSLDGSTEVTVSIRGKRIKKLDNDYLDLEWIPAEIVSYEQIIPEKVYNFNTGTSRSYIGTVDKIPIVEGKIYRVIFDGIEYTCDCWRGTLNDGEGVYLGDSSTYCSGYGEKNQHPTNDPFIIGFAEISGEPYLLMHTEYDNSLSSDQPHTVAIIGTEMIKQANKMPEKYLPDNMPVCVTFTVGVDDSEVTSDKTDAEIAALITSGKTVISKLVYNYLTISGNMSYDSNLEQFHASFFRGAEVYGIYGGLGQGWEFIPRKEIQYVTE